jgi:arylsulfatase A-like enzyme
LKAIMVMYDSLNRKMLEPYGCGWAHTPNFSRLADHSATFENCYGGSMPCMPARRELHTGRYNFLHASWGPIEPYDDSMPEILKDHGIHTHLVSDHYHYWQDGGATYHSRYSTWENVRGQENDQWKADLLLEDIPPYMYGQRKQNWNNRALMNEESKFPQHKTFSLGLDFIEKNRQADNWFLQIETFDPHEPFYAFTKYRDMYKDSLDGEKNDWPEYGPVKDARNIVDNFRCEYAALLSMCDYNLGRVLDIMDRYDMWEDTMLIVNTDHGFMLGEHDYMGKVVMPMYDEVIHIPLFIWDPRTGKKGVRRRSLVQTIDLAPTLLDYFGAKVPKDMQGLPLKDTVASDTPVRQAGLFGLFGAHVNVTDGRYVYMRGPAQPGNCPLYQYKLMPTEHGDLCRAFTPMEELAAASLRKPFSFTKGLPILKIPSGGFHGMDFYEFGTMLYDLKNDPGQQEPLNDKAHEARLTELMMELMEKSDCPPEQFERLGLPLT